MPVEILEPTTKRRLYEVMFLISQGVAADLAGAVDMINGIVERSGAETLAIKKWDERRLAYEIDKQKRGCYLLLYIKAEGEAPGKIEREVNLTDQIMRVLIVRADHMTDEQAIAENDRDGLLAEARLRADKAGAEEEKKSGVRLGAPEPEKTEEEAPEGENAEATEGGDAAPEASPEANAEGGDAPAEGETPDA